MDKRNTVVNIVRGDPFAILLNHRSMWKSNNVKTSIDMALVSVKYIKYTTMYICKKPNERCETPRLKSWISLNILYIVWYRKTSSNKIYYQIVNSTCVIRIDSEYIWMQQMRNKAKRCGANVWKYSGDKI